MMIRRWSIRIILTLLGSVCLAVPTVSAKTIQQKLDAHRHPKLANYYLATPISMTDAHQLAKWDVLVLSMQAQDNSVAALQQLRQINPNIIILAYVPSEEFPITSYLQWEKNPNGVWHRLLSGITNNMWLLDDTGNHVTFWKDNWMLNIAHPAPGARLWHEYLSSFVADELLSTGLWDGVFYDNLFTDVAWINNGNIDINGNGQKDSGTEIRSKWIAGMNKLFVQTREKTSKEIIIVGNGETGYYDNINGHYFENFSKDKDSLWTQKMTRYRDSATKSVSPEVSIIGNNTGNTGKSDDYKNVRFGITSALLEEGYYGFDFGDGDHSQLWFYDEYRTDLGDAINGAESITGKTQYTPDVWRRDFERGVALVNSSGKQRNIDLGGEFEKISGTQDPIVNNGAIVSQTTIDGYDGLILLKTFETLQDVVFSNGSFARFFNSTGERVRNGFFVFEEGYKGGEQIAHIDIDNNGKRDLVVVTQNKIMAWRDDGQPYMRVYPYTANYRGELRVAIGDLNGDNIMEIYAAPSSGYPAPIKIYSRHGSQMKKDWYPFGTGYTGGYHLAIGNVDGARTDDLVIGTGKGVSPLVSVYNRYLSRQYSWQPFVESFRGGVDVAVGDVTGDGNDNIVTAAAAQADPSIRTFSGSGKLIGEQFEAYASTKSPGILVEVADVNFDGIEDIIGLSKGFGF